MELDDWWTFYGGFGKIEGMKGKVGELVEKSKKTLKKEGVGSLFVKARNWTVFQFKKKRMKQDVKDILFINGCSIDYCERYRVHHKMEELVASGISCDEIDVGMLDEKHIRYYRGFVFYRTPHMPRLEEFVKKAQSYNKTVFYDIDDLVFDLKYTSKIEGLKKLSKEDLEEYNDGVVRYGKMMDLCDYCITTTKVIAEEMRKRGKETCIDKNIASLTMQQFSELAIKEVSRDEEEIVIGYASGSTTHNADFEMVKPALMNILRKYPNVVLKLVGPVEVPEEFREFGKQVVTAPFVNYTKLPYIIRSFDINLAPLTDTFFNAAKSCIKWMEAGFVKVPTIASDVGDFHDSVTDGVDGVLCSEDEWFEKIEQLVLDAELRKKLGDGAYRTVNDKYTVIRSGRTVSEFIMSRLHPNVCFVLPGVNISGGILVATRHAEILRENGYDVFMINVDPATAKTTKMGRGEINVVPFEGPRFYQHIDIMVATMWLTLPKVLDYSLCNDKRYLVQGKETEFYEFPNPNILEANATYLVQGIKYLTISKWCQKWLLEDYSEKAKYAPNGIFLSDFKVKERKFSGARKVKILIEGNSNNHYKNVDEAFRIVQKLDPSRYEIIYLSYQGGPKEWYKVDKFYNRIPHEEISRIYEEADILLKTSLTESFSFPPLEMMATGGLVVARPNGGNKEFLKDGENCLLYKTEEEAVSKIEELVSDEKLRDRLIKNGLETAKGRDWAKIQGEVLELYK